MSQRNISATLECFVKKDGKYLMLHRNPDKKIMPNVWMAPGGHREFNEGLIECAKREIYEETGLKIKNIKIKVVGNAYLKDLNTEFYFHLLTADYESGELISHPTDGELKWLSPNEIYKLDNLLAELKEVLSHIFSDSESAISYKAEYEKDNKLTLFELEQS